MLISIIFCRISDEPAEVSNGDISYRPVDADPEPGDDETDNSNGKKKKIVRYYDGVNPEVEAELQKVIDELEQRGIPKIDVVE